MVSEKCTVFIGQPCIIVIPNMVKLKQIIAYNTCADKALTSVLSLETFPSPFSDTKDLCNDFCSSSTELTFDGMSFIST